MGDKSTEKSSPQRAPASSSPPAEQTPAEQTLAEQAPAEAAETAEAAEGFHNAQHWATLTAEVSWIQQLLQHVLM